jgi:hypothetical protein
VIGIAISYQMCFVQADLCYKSKEEQVQLLQQIVAASEEYAVKLREKQRMYSLAEMINIIKARNQTKMKSVVLEQPLM